MTPEVQLVIPAAGMGTRLGRSEPKALVTLAGRPLIVRTLAAFGPLGLTRSAIVLYPAGYYDAFDITLRRAYPTDEIQLSEGGAERQDSVRNALDRVHPAVEFILLHDAARPFVDPTTISTAIMAARLHGGATVAVPSADTVLEGSPDAMLAGTPDRSRLWMCQTPQVFRAGPFREAHARAQAEGKRFTDDATLFRAYGGSVKIVQGTAENRKITTEEDLRYSEYLLSPRK